MCELKKQYLAWGHEHGGAHNACTMKACLSVQEDGEELAVNDDVDVVLPPSFRLVLEVLRGFEVLVIVGLERAPECGHLGGEIRYALLETAVALELGRDELGDLIGEVGNFLIGHVCTGKSDAIVCDGVR